MRVTQWAQSIKNDKAKQAQIYLNQQKVQRQFGSSDLQQDTRVLADGQAAAAEFTLLESTERVIERPMT